MNIMTERCTIRNFSLDDIDSFMEYRNNLDWMRYQGFKGMSKETYENELLQDTSLVKGKQFAIINTTTGRLIGDIYLKKENNVYWIGYTIHPENSRKGYAKEAVVATIKWIANQGECIIKAGVLPENTASINLLENLNFTYLTTEDDELIYAYNIQQ